MASRYVTSLMALLLSFSALVARAQDNGLGGEPVAAGIDPSTLTYDYLVDGRLTQDDPVNHRYSTLQAAYAAAPAGTATRQTVIGIMPNVYQITGTASTPGLMITKNYITLRGLTNNRRSVVLADNRGNKEGAGSDTASYNGYVIIVNANGFTAENLTILNYCNVDYEYPGDSSKNLSKRSAIITQAVAFQASGDKHVYRNVAFLSRLDTTFMQTTRAYVQNAFLEGTADFLGGGTVSVWQDSEITFPTGTGVMSASGVVFIRTKFTATAGFQFYKSIGNPVALIDCTIPVNTPQAFAAWVNPAYGPIPVRPNLYSLTYRTKDTNGNPAVIADGSTGPLSYTLGRELSDAEALAFNPWNVLRATPTGVADDWDPAGVGPLYEGQGQGSLIYRMALSNPTPSIRTGAAGATVGATVSPLRAPDPTIRWSTGSPLVTLSQSTGASVVVTGNNHTTEAAYVPVNATASNGFYVTAWVFVEPTYIPAPTPLSLPKLNPPANGQVSVSYSLALNGLDDQSVLSWFTATDSSGSNARPVAVSRGNMPLNPYPLVLGDVGRYLGVTLQPKSNISDPGPALTAVSSTPIAISDIQTSVVSPNFRNFVTDPVSTYVSGYWTVLGTWTAVTAPNYINAWGLRVGSQGAALLYQQDGTFGDMQVDLFMTPEKTQGQGFGSPGGPADGDQIQKSDVYIKYDPRTRNGYALRFWRTTQSTEKIIFQLYQIQNGVGSPVSTEQQLTGVFKPDTTLSLKIIGNLFTATGFNSVDGETLSLQGTVASNSFGGAGVYWAGTTSAGNSNVYSQIQISYPSPVQLLTKAQLTRLPSGDYQSVINVQNTGGIAAQAVQLTAVTLGSASASNLPLDLGTIAAGASSTVSVTYPASAGTPGAGTVQRINGTYNGGTFGSSLRTIVPR